MRNQIKGPGYHIFYAVAVEEQGMEKIAYTLQEQINEAEKEWDIEFISNAKIDADSGGSGRSVYFGFQCCVLKSRNKGKT